MKKLVTIILIPAAILAIWLFTRGTEQAAQGPHGGDIKAAGNYWVEMKSNSNSVYSWLLDRNKMTIRNGDCYCEIWTVADDSSRTKVTMIPYGIDGFYGELKGDRYKQCIVLYEVNGEAISAIFEREGLIVESSLQLMDNSHAGIESEICQQ